MISPILVGREPGSLDLIGDGPNLALGHLGHLGLGQLGVDGHGRVERGRALLDAVANGLRHAVHLQRLEHDHDRGAGRIMTHDAAFHREWRPRTREQFVGMASSGEGFLGRWREYFASGHGGNVALKSRDPSDYQVSILETVGTSATIADLIELEWRWKDKLQSRQMGLNLN